MGSEALIHPDAPTAHLDNLLGAMASPRPVPPFVRINAMNLEDVLGKIRTDRANLQVDGLLVIRCR